MSLSVRTPYPLPVHRPVARVTCIPALLTSTLLACNIPATHDQDRPSAPQTADADTNESRRIPPFPAPPDAGITITQDAGTQADASDTVDADTSSLLDAREPLLNDVNGPDTGNINGTDADAGPGGGASDTWENHSLDARPDTNNTDTITNVEACPESVTTAAIDCITDRMTAPDSTWTGGWTEASTACAADEQTRRSLDLACLEGTSPRWCVAPGVGNHAAWTDDCAWVVDYRIRDSLCVFETRWDESLLTGRLVERSRQLLSSAQIAAAADSVAWAQALRVRWPDVDRAAIGFQRVDPASVIASAWWDLTNDKSWEVLTYRVDGQTWGAMVDADRVVGAQIRNGTTEACRAAEGVGARPCHDDHCGADRTCVGEREQLAGLCVDPTFEPDYVDCRAHTDCPVGFLCLPTVDTLECRPAWTRRVVSTWLDRELLAGGTMRTTITVRGLAPVGDQVAIWLHLDRPLPWNAEVWLLDPDGRPSVVPWSGDWTGWVPLPHAMVESDRNGAWQLELNLPSGSVPVLVEGWSLRVDSRLY